MYTCRPSGPTPLQYYAVAQRHGITCLVYHTVLTTTSKPTFLPWSLLDYVSLLAILHDHMIMYVGLFGHSAVVFHVFMFY